MTNENRIALIQLQSMLQTGELHGGSIRQRVQFVVAIEAALANDAEERRGMERASVTKDISPIVI